MSESHEPPQGRAPLHLVESRVSRARDDRTTIPEEGNPAGLEPRMLAAWREWLAALASDADAALAAADLYAGLAPPARDAWLDALEEDGPSLDVPLLALYAPLLGVETDPERRVRMEMAVAMGSEGGGEGGARIEAPVARAFSGMTESGARVVALIEPVYLQFVRVLWCRFVPDEGIHWARHDSLLANAHAPKNGDIVDGVTLERTPLAPIVEELAHAILAQRRHGSELPSSLREFADLFGTDVEALDGVV